jgi:mannose-1-phosphate guanylyltransferase
MKAVILAGGTGTRLRPLTNTRPKPMVPILNRPFLEHMLNNLELHNVTDVIMTVFYLPDKIRDHFGKNGYSSMNLSYVVEETPLGTAGAVKNVENLIDGTFLVLNGDIFTKLDISKMLLFHKKMNSMVTLFLTQVNDPSQFGVIEMEENGYIQKFIEKPQQGETGSNWINGGIYIVEPEVLQFAPTNEFYMFERGLFPALLKAGVPMYGYRDNSYWIDLGTPYNYLKVNHDLLNSIDYEHLIFSDDHNAIHNEDCFVHSSAIIEGPVILGSNCSIGARSVIKGPTVFGSGVTVGEESFVSGSVVWDDVHIGDRVNLIECMLANGVTISDQISIGNLCMVGADMNVTVDLTQGNTMGIM